MMHNKRRWYDKDRNDGVMFVDTTPNGELKRRVETACKRNEMRIKVVEKISGTIKKELQRSNPFGQQHCKRTDCITFNLGLQINCRKRGPVYEIWCKDCKAVEINEVPEENSMNERTEWNYVRIPEVAVV